ncbi:hypothetical protein EYF80_000789 [Liparis tanakae]|uniref:Uncharacterized protein n=1 Tax=Liparis tanakae TaxID=230148 RepID=A0A4Z2JG13_9TELE|nr:hypothetical protein EYF80_000789 [Liparis tanakae]
MAENLQRKPAVAFNSAWKPALTPWGSGELHLHRYSEASLSPPNTRNFTSSFSGEPQTLQLKLSLTVADSVAPVPVEQEHSSLMQRNRAPWVYLVTLVMAMTRPSMETGLMGPWLRGKLHRSNVYSGNGATVVTVFVHNAPESTSSSCILILNTS